MWGENNEPNGFGGYLQGAEWSEPPADYANVYNVDKLIFTAVEGSEYKAEKLVELLKPAVEEKPKKAKAEKSTAKKTTSKEKK